MRAICAWASSAGPRDRGLRRPPGESPAPPPQFGPDPSFCLPQRPRTAQASSRSVFSPESGHYSAAAIRLVFNAKGRSAVHGFGVFAARAYPARESFTSETLACQIVPSLDVVFSLLLQHSQRPQRAAPYVINSASSPPLHAPGPTSKPHRFHRCRAAGHVARRGSVETTGRRGHRCL